MCVYVCTEAVLLYIYVFSTSSMEFVIVTLTHWKNVSTYNFLINNLIKIKPPNSDNFTED